MKIFIDFNEYCHPCLGEAGEENPQAVGQAAEEVGTEGNSCWYGYSEERISCSEGNYYWTGT